MNILVINAGSSSLKFQIIATDLERIRQDKDVRLLRGEVERIGAEAVVTVDWTTKTSRPASTAGMPIERALGGVTEAAASTPACLISWIRRAIRCSLIGS